MKNLHFRKFPFRAKCKRNPVACLTPTLKDNLKQKLWYNSGLKEEEPQCRQILKMFLQFCTWQSIYCMSCQLLQGYKNVLESQVFKNGMYKVHFNTFALYLVGTKWTFHGQYSFALFNLIHSKSSKWCCSCSGVLLPQCLQYRGKNRVCLKRQDTHTPEAGCPQQLSRQLPWGHTFIEKLKTPLTKPSKVRRMLDICDCLLWNLANLTSNLWVFSRWHAKNTETSH